MTFGELEVGDWFELIETEDSHNNWFFGRQFVKVVERLIGINCQSDDGYNCWFGDETEVQLVGRRKDGA